MDIKIESTNSIIIYFGEVISKETSLKVKAAYVYLKNLNNKGIIDLIPSYTTLHITYDIFKFDSKEFIFFLEDNLKDIKPYDVNNTKIIEIDVYYDPEVGFDLNRVASLSSISIEDVINIHSSKIYDVYAIGFLPGFAYLASIDEKIIVPRLETPRKVIPKGSVAIADNQTAVYPKDSPGGWNILGRTTFEFFDKTLDELSSISIDSRIKFNSITKDKFLDQGGLI